MDKDPSDNQKASGSNQQELGECSSDEEITYLPQENNIAPHAPTPLFKPDPSNSLGEGEISERSPPLSLPNDAQMKFEQFPVEPIDEKKLRNMGLPSTFTNRSGEDFEPQDYKMDTRLPPNYFTGAVNYQDQQTVRKGQKETFYCELCLLELNSRDTLISHTKGQKHIKREEQHQAEVRRGEHRGYYVEEKKVRPIANPLPLQKKVPVRLNEKLRETTTAIVGLDYVHEIIACSNAEVEPYYECTLCGQQGEANAMFQHLQGKPHRSKLLQEKYPDNRKYIEGTLNQGFLEKEIERLNLRENCNLEKINTVYSDEMFPWTAGKAPWSVEQGGTGVVPTRARNRVGLISQSNQQLFGGRNKSSKPEKIGFNDLDQHILGIKIETDGDRKRACSIVQKLSEKIRDYSIEHGRSNPLELELIFSQIDAIMEVVSLKDKSDDGEDPKRVRNTSPMRGSSIKQEMSPRSYGEARYERGRSGEYDNGYESSRYHRSGSRPRNGREGSRERHYHNHDRRGRRSDDRY